MFIKRFFLIFLSFFCVFYLFADNTNLYPIRKRLQSTSVKYLFGYIDYDGNMVVPFEYSWATTFEDGYATVCKNDRYFIIDTNNRIVFSLKNGMRFSGGFHEGLCVFKDENKKYGYMDTNGNVIIPKDYQFKGKKDVLFDYANDFINGIAEIRIGQKKSFINKNGEIITDLSKHNTRQYKNDNYEIFLENSNSLYGLKNNEGKIIFDAKYTYLSLPTKYGLCIFSNGEDGPSYGLISIDGTIVYDENTFYEVSEFENGMALFSPRNQHGGYIREDGKVFYYKDYY